MKKHLKKILVFLLTLISLASCFVVFASAVPVSVLASSRGYFDYGTLTFTTELFTTGDDASEGPYSDTVGFGYGTLLFDDEVTFVDYRRATFEPLGVALVELGNEGYYLYSLDCTVTFSSGKFSLDDFTLYSTYPYTYFSYFGPSIGNKYFFDDVSLTVRSSTGVTSTVPAAYVNGRWIPRLDGTNVRYGVGFTIVSFNFSLYVNNPGEDYRGESCYLLAEELGVNRHGEYYPDPDSFSIWGYPGLYFDAADDDESFREGYEQGKQEGLSAARDEAFNRGHHEGYFEGFDKGYNQSINDNLSVWYNTGYDAGERDGISLGYDDGYDTGYDVGRQSGYNEGFNAGHTTDLDLSMGGLFTEVIGAPVKVVVSTLNFDFLGVNLADTFRGLITLGILIAVVSLIVKVFL